MTDMTPEAVAAEMAADYRKKTNDATRRAYLEALETAKAERIAARAAEEEEKLELECKRRFNRACPHAIGDERAYQAMRAKIKQTVIDERFEREADSDERHRRQALATGRYAF